MFQGTIPTEMRSIVAQHAQLWPDGADVYVGCSGNLTIERTLDGTCANKGFRLHSNDVNPYSCALGWAYAREELPFTVKEESIDELGWLHDDGYLDHQLGTLATLMLGTRWFAFVGKTGAYHQRMCQANRQQFPRMHAETVAKLEQVTLKLADFYAGDVREYLRAVPETAPVASFPPFWCLERNERILTADMRWVPCGDLVEGQQILAFDEEPEPGSRMRRWKYATITRSEPAMKDCVRVHLENGDSIVCTTDHPWLATPARGGKAAWVDAMDLLRPSKFPTRDTQPIASYVYKAVTPWTRAETFEDGWMSGIFDGEGTIMMPNGAGHGTAKISIFQVKGRVLDQAVAILRSHGFRLDIREKTPSEFSKQTVHQVYITGGFREILRALGTFQPIRLIDRLHNDLDISKQTVRVNARDAGRGRVKVVDVEYLGPREIQSISTSSRTYVGEGYLMHNSGGYETMFKGIEDHFDWPEPEYEILDEDGKQEIVDLIVNRPNWLLGLHFEDPKLEEFRVGYVKTTPRAMPIWVYANPGITRYVGPSQKTEPVLMRRLGPDDDLGDDLTLHPLTGPQFNSLRSAYLGRGIAPGAPLFSCAVSSGGRIIGAFGWLPPKYGLDAYLMSDFSVAPTKYKRLSKLIVMAAISAESQSLVQRALSKRCVGWATTAFTNNPTSAKYGRGVPGVKLYTRKNCDDGHHKYQLQYGGPLGQWTLAEALDTWREKHGATA